MLFENMHHIAMPSMICRQCICIQKTHTYTEGWRERGRVRDGERRREGEMEGERGEEKRGEARWREIERGRDRGQGER